MLAPCANGVQVWRQRQTDNDRSRCGRRRPPRPAAAGGGQLRQPAVGASGCGRHAGVQASGRQPRRQPQVEPSGGRGGRRRTSRPAAAGGGSRCEATRPTSSQRWNPAVGAGGEIDSCERLQRPVANGSRGDCGRRLRPEKAAAVTGGSKRAQAAAAAMAGLLPHGAPAKPPRPANDGGGAGGVYRDGADVALRRGGRRQSGAQRGRAGGERGGGRRGGGGPQVRGSGARSSALGGLGGVPPRLPARCFASARPDLIGQQTLFVLILQEQIDRTEARKQDEAATVCAGATQTCCCLKRRIQAEG